MNQKGFVNIILIFLVVVLVGAAGYFTLNRMSVPSPTPQPPVNTTVNTTPTQPTNTVIQPASPTAIYKYKKPTLSESSNALKITSVSPLTATIGSTITVSGSGFSRQNPVKQMGMQDEQFDATVVMQNANGQKVSVFSLIPGGKEKHNDNVITFTLPSRVCNNNARGCSDSDSDPDWIHITPGMYSLFVFIPNTGLVSNSVNINVQ